MNWSVMLSIHKHRKNMFAFVIFTSLTTGKYLRKEDDSGDYTEYSLVEMEE